MECDRDGMARVRHTTMPMRTFSPPAFSSTASSRTMFRKTYVMGAGMSERVDRRVWALESWTAGTGFARGVGGG